MLSLTELYYNITTLNIKYCLLRKVMRLYFIYKIDIKLLDINSYLY